MSYCVFCEIIAGRSPATVFYEDDDVIAFRNVLLWVPVMLHVVPKQHLLQEELWTSPLIGKIARIASSLGREMCPKGFRLVSNVGPDAMQSQPHAHMHVVGGVYMGATGPLRRDEVEIPLHRDDALEVSQDEHGWVPVMMLASPLAHADQWAFWSDEEAFARAASIVIAQAKANRRLQYGYRMAGNFGVDCGNPEQIPHLHALGGTFLGEYVDT